MYRWKKNEILSISFAFMISLQQVLFFSFLSYFNQRSKKRNFTFFFLTSEFQIKIAQKWEPLKRNYKKTKYLVFLCYFSIHVHINDFHKDYFVLTLDWFWKMWDHALWCIVILILPRRTPFVDTNRYSVHREFVQIEPMNDYQGFFTIRSIHNKIICESLLNLDELFELCQC